MNQVEWFNKVSYILDNLQSDVKEVDFYDKCVRIKVSDNDSDIVSKDLNFIANSVKEYKVNNLDVTMSKSMDKYRGRVKFNYMTFWERYVSRYRTTIDCMP